MSELVLVTYDWVPEMVWGFVRDLRARWALEEAGLAYRVESTPFKDRGPEHIAHQPFGQVPWLTDGDISIFESGAILLHLGELSDELMPTDPKRRAEVKEWLFAALNSVEMATLPWVMFNFMGFTDATPTWKWIDDFVKLRLSRMEPVLAKGEWLAGTFSIADIMMADVLRVLNRFDGMKDYPACRAYVERATGRAAFKKAHTDQMAHFAKGDAERTAR